MKPGNGNAAMVYANAEVMTLSQRDLIIKLYKGAEGFLLQAVHHIRNEELGLGGQKCQKAKRIFMELLSTLNFEAPGDIAEKLRDLYLFLVTEISEASLRKEPERIVKLLPVIATLREGWESVPENEANVSSLDQDRGGHSLDIRT